MTHAVFPSAIDRELVDVAEYVCNYRVKDEQAYAFAYRSFIDTLACAFFAAKNPDCLRVVGPTVPGATLQPGSRVPGTALELDPVSATFNIGVLTRWLELNDTFTGATGSHPADNLSGILAVADYLGRTGRKPLLLREVMEHLIKAYEIQGCHAMENECFSIHSSIDHVMLTKVATASVVTGMLGGGVDEVISACSNAWMSPTLRAYRHAPNVGSRKGWAAADASSQAVMLALLAMKGEMAYPLVLSAPKFGFYDGFCGGKRFSFPRPYGEYVIQHVMLKSVPSGMYGQTAVECAIRLHPMVKDRIEHIRRIDIYTQKSLLGIMSKDGPLKNHADRDHSVQYIVAIGLLFGRLNPDDCNDDVAADPRIDVLRGKMHVVEDPEFTRSSADPAILASGNGIQVHFTDGTATPRVDIEFPAGHPSRLQEAAPIFRDKLLRAIEMCFTPKQGKQLLAICDTQSKFEQTTVSELMDAMSLG